MDFDKLNKWADLLFDTGKRNNLISFKDTKLGTVEIVSPSFCTLFSRAEHSATFEVYDPKLDDDDDFDADYQDGRVGSKEKRLSRAEYIDAYAGRIKKSSQQILAYNPYVNPKLALRSIGKKANVAIEETGVNIAYMAFGFICWTENEDSDAPVMRAPVLLAPVSIENESAVEPYYIKITGSEIIVNPAFSFKLKSDFGIELPDYDDEDVDEYLQRVEEKISKLRWSITRECKISTFSFLKINMHRDLKDNAGVILKNNSVRALLGEKSAAADSGNVEVAYELHNVVDADSSQAEAIKLAGSGKSFVLQGPPGTGKSQTITNIIAECLGEGKKVLFVSEKLAALNVVYDKLKQAGLEEFCLELHSHKANKKDVIAELCHTLKLDKSAVSERAWRETAAKERIQHELDEYAEQLHKVRPVINKTLFSLYEEISANRNAPGVDFVISDIKSRGEEYIEDAEIALTRYAEYTSSIGEDYHKNAWYGYVGYDSSYQRKAELKCDLEGAISFCEGIDGIGENLDKRYSIPLESVRGAYTVRDFLKLVTESEFITPALLNSAKLSDKLSTVQAMRSLALEIRAIKDSLDEVFDEDFYKLDGAAYHKKLTREFTGFFLRLISSEYRGILADIRMCRRDGKRPNYKFAVAMTDELCLYQQKLQKFTTLEKKIKESLGTAYEGVSTDFDILISELGELIRIKGEGVSFGKLTLLTRQDFSEKRLQLKEIHLELEKCFAAFGEFEKRVEESFDKEIYDVTSIAPRVLLNKYKSCLEGIGELDNFCEFSRLLDRLSSLSLISFVDYTIKRKIEPSKILSAYKKAFYTQWVDAVLHDSPFLISMSRIPHDEAVKLFREKDQLGFEINKAKIKARLSAERPSLDMVAQGSAVSVLLREGEKKRKQKSIRLLLEEISELVQTLKPCFLMSPLSVSTFLSADMRFDVVIFDEASQIFPQDAVGAIYRGKQLIVVGDSKQMPPSNFFNSMSGQDDDDEEIEDVTDFESILDLCSASFAQKRLKWHYRSRFEQLIAFSNKNFYDNDLVTFPSSRKDAVGIGVDYFYVDGTFDRSTKTNRKEAERVVDLVFENIERYPERSLGVVAFSISQQNLIEKLIRKRRQADSSKEKFFKSDKKEPFFVKNLETVQGDERDTIIFSVAYAKDADGRLLLNFGPVNRDGGERRLNVAVTRAKYNVQLVSSMHYSDIDLSRTKSHGARLLREYLDFAENGDVALKRENAGNIFEERAADFENEVCDFLRESGFCVDTSVGCSSLKIDIALKDSDSDDYVLAIECDGEAYRDSKSTRDRDRLRSEVLERMGWSFYRIWSTDWFRNKRTEKERLLCAARAAIKRSGAKGDKLTEKSISFEEIAQVRHFEFPRYRMTDEYAAAKMLNNDKLRVILTIVENEAPISEEWLLKRVAFLFGREKVTSVVRDEFDYITRNIDDYKIIRKGGFLYYKNCDVPMLRVPEENATLIREVKYILPDELALGMREILEQNITVPKMGLYRLVAQRLGFSRIGDAMLERFDVALQLISGQIKFDGDNLSLK